MSKVRTSSEEGSLRIGELARRAGIPAATLRAWERRYGVVSPARGESGYRLYSAGDERALRRMADLVAGGLAPAEAARRVLEGARAGGDVPVAGLRDALAGAISEFDDRAADQVIDRALTLLSTDSLLDDVLLPVVRDLEQASVGQEHFASNLIRGRLMAVARGWGGSDGRLALLACPGGELHDIGLIAFGIALRERGWRIFFLGANTPADALRAAAAAMAPEAIVLFSMDADLYDGWDSELAQLTGDASVMLGGPGADEALCARLGAVRLAGGPLAAAAAIA